MFKIKNNQKHQPSDFIKQTTFNNTLQAKIKTSKKTKSFSITTNLYKFKISQILPKQHLR
jgi:hypothetical protein